MGDRKRRSQDGNTMGTEKRPRSTLPFKKNATWGTRTTALQLADHSSTASVQTELDHGMEEAIAALLEIGCTKRKLKLPDTGEKPTLRHLQLPRTPRMERTERPSLFKRVQLARGAAKLVEKRTVADCLPTTSSGSDGSTAVALTRNSERTSFDSITCPAGPAQHRIVRQDSVKLLSKEPLEVRINCSGRDSEPKTPARDGSPARATAFAQEACQVLAIPQQVAAAGRAATPASSHWNSRVSGAAVITSKPGCAIVSTGVPEAPNSRMQASHPSKVGLIAAQQPTSGVHLPQQLLHTISTKGQQSRPVASFSGGRLIVIAAAQPAAPSPPPVSPEQKGTTAVGHRVLPHAQPPQLMGTPVAAGSGMKTADKPLWQSATASAANAGAGASSGDESCDDTWQSNWGLDLFSVLNPSVITTGHCTFREGN